MSEIDFHRTEPYICPTCVHKVIYQPCPACTARSSQTKMHLERRPQVRLAALGPPAPAETATEPSFLGWPGW
jgi:hypothetical protein